MSVRIAPAYPLRRHDASVDRVRHDAHESRRLHASTLHMSETLSHGCSARPALVPELAHEPRREWLSQETGDDQRRQAQQE
jgi:hypothetical protein